MGSSFEDRPLTPQTWADLKALFDLPGGSMVRGCWCMYYRKSGTVQVSAQAGADNKQELCELVDSGVVRGLMGYVDGAPAGWISLGCVAHSRQSQRDHESSRQSSVRSVRL